MTDKQKETLKAITDRWDNKKKGTYINRKNSRAIALLEKAGLVIIYPYSMEFGREAYPIGAGE